MKTIEERAKDSCKEWCGGELDNDIQEDCFCDGFIAGALSERNNLLRWRNPQKELPEDGQYVLVKSDVGILTARHCGNGEFLVNGCGIGYVELSDDERDEDTCDIIGWRPIIEIE